MTKTEILNDLEYVKSMAEEGRTTPLLGGRIGLMWGVLLAITFFGHWAIISGTAGLPQSALGILWLSYAIIGGIGNALLGRSLQGKPGISSVGNRTENAVWVSFVLMMIACFIGIVLNMVFNDTTPAMFDMMVCIGFAGQIIAYLVIGTMSHERSQRIPGLLAVLATIVSFALLGKPELYLAASIAVIFTIIVPSLGQIRKEPKAVV
ncbi:MAG: hypothetical protein EX271_05590 [Acidimicrobiales bacterium]|nr:hypothetical protein [Hyphomonadaceae bacterium]RZV42580.1 MAG: hypothetical protein EX271_05590 [Acidimicrobiales bacterium]